MCERPGCPVGSPPAVETCLLQFLLLYFNVGYAIILPLRAASAVSRRELVVVSEVVVSQKDVHSCSEYLIKSVSFRSEVLKRRRGGTRVYSYKQFDGDRSKKKKYC